MCHSCNKSCTKSVEVRESAEHAAMWQSAQNDNLNICNAFEKQLHQVIFKVRESAWKCVKVRNMPQCCNLLQNDKLHVFIAF